VPLLGKKVTVLVGLECALAIAGHAPDIAKRSVFVRRRPTQASRRLLRRNCRSLGRKRAGKR
jgi:hypothetical protein